MESRTLRFWMSLSVLTGVLAASVIVARRTQWAGRMAIPRDRMKGSPQASVIMLEFSDFQCPSCKRALPQVEELLKLYPDDLAVVFKHYPLEKMHRWARIAARGAECARTQMKFWGYHDLLYGKQEEWSKSETAPKASFLAMAKNLGLQEDRFARCLDSLEPDTAINSDMAEAERLQVGATPTFFLGDFRLVGSAQLRRDGPRLIEVIRNEKKRR